MDSSSYQWLFLPNNWFSTASKRKSHVLFLLFFFFVLSCSFLIALNATDVLCFIHKKQTIPLFLFAAKSVNYLGLAFIGDTMIVFFNNTIY